MSIVRRRTDTHFLYGMLFCVLLQISFHLGLAWNGPEGFDKTRFLQEVDRVEIMPDGEIILQRNRQAA